MALHIHLVVDSETASLALSPAERASSEADRAIAVASRSGRAQDLRAAATACQRAERAHLNAAKASREMGFPDKEHLAQASRYQWLNNDLTKRVQG